MADFVKNADRAARARRLVNLYRKEVGHEGSEELYTSVGDLLADLRHLCEVEGLDWDEVDSDGETNFEEELADER